MKKNIPNSNKGYTLIELLTVVVILVIVTSIVAGIFFSTLRGTSKTKINTAIAQNGNYAISVMSNAISSSTDVIEIGGTPINGCISAKKGNQIKLARESSEPTIFTCDVAQGTIASNGASLLDMSTVEVDAGDLTACYFRCAQPNADKYAQPRIEIFFTITNKTGDGASESQASQTFKQTVTMRNFRPH